MAKSKNETKKDKTMKTKTSTSNSRKKAEPDKSETSTTASQKTKRTRSTKTKVPVSEPVVEDVWSLGNKSKFNTSNEPAPQKRSKQKKTATKTTKATTQKSVSSSQKRKNTCKTGKSDTGKSDIREAELVTNDDFDVMDDYDGNGNATDFANTANIRDTSVPAVPLNTPLNKSNDPKLEFSGLEQVLADLPEDVVDNMHTIQNRIMLI